MNVKQQLRNAIATVIATRLEDHHEYLKNILNVSNEGNKIALLFKDTIDATNAINAAIVKGTATQDRRLVTIEIDTDGIEAFENFFESNEGYVDYLTSTLCEAICRHAAGAKNFSMQHLEEANELYSRVDELVSKCDVSAPEGLLALSFNAFGSIQMCFKNPICALLAFGNMAGNNEVVSTLENNNYVVSLKYTDKTKSVEEAVIAMSKAFGVEKMGWLDLINLANNLYYHRPPVY